MAHTVFVICVLLGVFSTADTTQEDASTTTPPPLTFDCSGGKITVIKGSNIKMNSVLVDIKQDGTLCHYSDHNCNWQNKQILRVIYEPDEDDIDSKFVAGKLYRYILECKTGYFAQASVAAFEINRVVTKPYYHQNVTAQPTPNAIRVNIFKQGDTHELNEKVFVGDPLVLKITGPASHSLKPVKCSAYNKDSIRKKYTLWDNTGCKSYDGAVMSNTWKTAVDNSIAINMFAFRFVDSLAITIECSAYVCPLKDATCGESIHDCLRTTSTTKTTAATAPVGTTKTKRRRRSNTRNDYKEKIGSTSFTVVDGDSDSSGCAGFSSNITLYLTTLFVCLLII